MKSATHSDQLELVLRFLCAVAVVLNFSFLLDQELLQLVVLVRSLVIVHGVVSRPCRRAGDYGVKTQAVGRGEETRNGWHDDDAVCFQETLSLRIFSCFYSSKNAHKHTRTLGTLHTLVTSEDVRGIIAQIIQKYDTSALGFCIFVCSRGLRRRRSRAVSGHDLPQC